MAPLKLTFRKRSAKSPNLATAASKNAASSILGKQDQFGGDLEHKNRFDHAQLMNPIIVLPELDLFFLNLYP